MNEVCNMNQCPYPIASLKENIDKLIKIFETFKKYLQQHDQYRGTNFAVVFPELNKYL